MSTIHVCYHPHHSFDTKILSQMLKASEYWEPDALSQTSSVLKNCYLGKAALFTTERSKQDKVYTDAKTGNIITANARLDNREVLAGKLGLNQEALENLSDSQLILLCYQEWGESCPKELLGDFVFIIWDQSRARLFVARDHFGVKVLYYCQNEKGTMLTNEHNAFFTSDWQPNVMNESWLVRHLWGLQPEPVESPCEGISVFPPAHSMTIDSDGLTLKRYWSLEDKNDWQGMDDEALIEELKTRFTEAVRVRLDSAYPVGAELSEGLDSNGIAGYAARILGERPLKTFSYVCERLTDANRHIWGATYKDIFEMLALHKNLEPVWSDEKVSDEVIAHRLSQYYKRLGGVMDLADYFMPVHQLAQKNGVKVMLSGWGGDHCVTAPGDFYESELFEARKFKELNQLIQAKKARGRGMSPFKAWFWILIKHISPCSFRWLLQRRCGLEASLWRRSKLSPLRSDYIKKYSLKKKLHRYIQGYQKYSVKGYHQRELSEVGVEWRLVETELLARFHRIEYRFPMLDIPLVEFAYNMPSHLKIFGGVERYMFRRVLQGVTTQRIQWRRKADVSCPIDPDFENEFKSKVVTYKLFVEAEGGGKYFDQVRLEQILSMASKEYDDSMLKSLRLMRSVVIYQDF